MVGRLNLLSRFEATSLAMIPLLALGADARRQSPTKAESRIARAFGLDDEGWVGDTNPWSGWVRITTCLPLLMLAIWNRARLGW